ncbi:MAG: hypothetical protein ACUVSM_01065 [Armatimonadota bacterium]|jgi:hypothetical protein
MASFWGPHTDNPEKTLFILGALVTGALFIFGLTFVPRRARKPLIAVVTFIGGLYFSLEFLIAPRSSAEPFLLSKGAFGKKVFELLYAGLDPDQNFLSPYMQGLTNAWQVIAGFTFALGLTNLVHIHGKNILQARKNWGFSVFFFIGVIVMAVIGFFQRFGAGRESPVWQGLWRIATDGWLFSLDAAMFSLIAFFIISAAYRAFRIRSVEATIMMGAAFLVMLGQVPVGIWLTSWIQPDWGFLYNLRLENISQWILWKPNAAAQRGIEFGIAVGALAMGLRIWLSLERGSYFEKEV